MMTQQILIVENDPNWHQMLDEVSANLGYTTRQAGLAKEALQVLRETDIALILLDIKLPGIKGHQLLQQLRKIKIAVPVIVVAGYLTPEVVELLIDSRIQGIIVKSEFRVQRLADAISTALERV
tara:strand:- start:192 stop:563 length:372 start_codon:yes stop_codon:yes gene_type:complete